MNKEKIIVDAHKDVVESFERFRRTGISFTPEQKEAVKGGVER